MVARIIVLRDVIEKYLPPPTRRLFVRTEWSVDSFQTVRVSKRFATIFTVRLHIGKREVIEGERGEIKGC